MKKVYLLALFLLIVPLVLGVSTPITIKAPVDNNVTINIIRTENDLLLKTYQVLTNSAGEANIIHESDFAGSIYITAAARKEGRITSYNESSPIYKSPDFYSGNALTIDYIRAPVAPIPTPTPNVTTPPVATPEPTPELVPETTSQDATQTDTSTTGNSILENLPLKEIGVYALWIIGAVIVLGIIVLLVIKVAIPYFNNPVRKAEFSGYSTVDLNDKRVVKELEKAEIKLKEAQAEIDRIKNKRNEVKEAEAKFEQAKRELERVKGKS